MEKADTVEYAAAGAPWMERERGWTVGPTISAIPQFPFWRTHRSPRATATPRVSPKSTATPKATSEPPPPMLRATMYWRTTGVVLALRPLACVFSSAELVLLVLFTLLYDRWRWAIESEPRQVTEELQSQDPVPQQTTRKTAPRSVKAKKKAAAKKAARSDMIGGGKLATAAGMTFKSRNASRDAKMRDESCSSAATDDESVDSWSTSDMCNLSSLSTPLARQHKIERMSDHEFPDALFASMAMSQCSSEVVPNFEFMHQSGELQIRGDTVLDVFKPWRKCSILLSVMTGELFVHRKVKTPPQVFPLSRFTGAAIHSKRRHSFKAMFDGHPPLYFRATTIQDAEHWVKALEYAKETTWRLWL